MGSDTAWCSRGRNSFPRIWDSIENLSRSEKGEKILEYIKRRLMKIRPLQDRVIVKRVKEEEKTKGGIIIPEIAKEKPVQGEVIAVGTTQSIKVGDKVLFGRYVGAEISINDVEHLIMREDDILGVIEEQGEKNEAD